MKALITGASGFIGSTLVAELGTIGFEASALLRKTSNISNLRDMKYERLDGDLSDESSLRKAVQGVNYVFHLAGVTAAKNRDGYFAHNTLGTERIARAVAEENPKISRFVYVSSLAAGGPALSLKRRDETDPDAPVSAYGESKLEAEKTLLKFKNTFPITIIRPPLVYGPKDKAVFTIIKTVARNLMPILQGSSETGQKYYSAIHVKDLCKGLVQAAVSKGLESGEVFYLSDDSIYTYQELLSTMADKLGCDPLRIRVPKGAVKAVALALSALGALTRRTYPLNRDKLNEILPDYWICSNQKARAKLGFTPEFDLAQGMSDAIEWYRKNNWL